MTSKPRFLLASLCTLLTALPIAASAQQANTVKAVNVRAGPDRDYPLVARFGPGTPLSVQGCTEGFGWCDVIAPDGTRGWIYAGNIVYPYQSRPVPVLGYGALIGLPIVTFAIGSYWGDHYRGRPWYGNRSRWENRPPPRPIYHGPPPGYRPPPPGFRPPPPGGWRPGDHRPGDYRPGDHRPGDYRPPPGARPSPRPEPGQRPGGGRPVFQGGAGAGAQGPGERAPRPQRPAGPAPNGAGAQ